MGQLLDITADGHSFGGYLATPSGSARGGLVLLHEIWGLNAHITDVADRFAEEGYVVLAPDLLTGTGIDVEQLADTQRDLADPHRRHLAQPRLRELAAPTRSPQFAATALSRLGACVDSLADRDDVGGRIGAVGFCFGGSYVFALAAHDRRLAAAVPFYGTADLTADDLAHIHCPILAFYGEQDTNLIDALPDLTTRMRDAGIDFTPEVYRDAGHAFFNDTNNFAFSPLAAESAWNQTLEFLAARLP